MRRPSLVLWVLWVGCQTPGHPADSGSARGAPPNPCEQATVTVHPSPGANDVDLQTPLSFTLSSPEPTAVVTLVGVSGTSEVHGDKVVFLPSEPLQSSTAYDLRLDWSCGPTTSTFATTDHADALDPSTLVGGTWQLDMDQGQFVSPVGIHPLLTALLDEDLLIGVTHANMTNAGFRMGMGAGGVQDLCRPTVDFAVDADFTENPQFLTGSPQLFVPLDAAFLRIDNATLAGTFGPDGATIVGVALTGSLDLTPLTAALGEAPCAFLEGFGGQCQPCAGGGATCVALDVNSLVATRLPGVQLVERTPVAIAATPACP